MDRIGLAALIALLAAVPGAGVCAEARVADVRVGQHGDYERIVVELQADREVGVRWTGDASGAEIFEIAARPLLARQLLSSGRPHVGEMLLLAAQGGAELRLEPQARRTRAFLLDEPRRLVIDIAAPGEAAFEPPADVHAIRRESAEPPAPEPEAAAAPAAPAPLAEASVEPQSAESTAADVPAPMPEPEQAEAAAPPTPAPGELPVQQPRTRANWLQSRALVVPVLVGIGVLILAVGGLALASAQRPRRAPPAAVELPEATALSADRLDLLEKRLDEEARARAQLAEQVAQVHDELGGMRDLFARLRAQAAARSAAPSAPQ